MQLNQPAPCHQYMDMHFRKVLGEKYDEIERPIWTEGGKEVNKLATALGLPSGNAIEVNEAFGVIGTILFGREFRFEIVKCSYL